MGRGPRLKILLGACIIGTIGVIVHSNLLISGAVVMLLLSCVRYRQSAPTNYTEKFGPPDPSDLSADEIATPFTEDLTDDDQESED